MRETTLQEPICTAEPDGFDDGDTRPAARGVWAGAEFDVQGAIIMDSKFPHRLHRMHSSDE